MEIMQNKEHVNIISNISYGSKMLSKCLSDAKAFRPQILCEALLKRLSLSLAFQNSVLLHSSFNTSVKDSCKRCLLDSSLIEIKEVRTRTKYAKNRGFELSKFKFEKNLLAKEHKHLAIFFHIFCRSGCSFFTYNLSFYTSFRQICFASLLSFQFVFHAIFHFYLMQIYSCTPSKYQISI